MTGGDRRETKKEINTLPKIKKLLTNCSVMCFLIDKCSTLCSREEKNRYVTVLILEKTSTTLSIKLKWKIINILELSRKMMYPIMI